MLMTTRIAARSSCNILSKTLILNSTKVEQCRQYQSFRAEETEVIRASFLQSPPNTMKGLDFGKHFTDHMLAIEWHENVGWSRPLIRPLAALNLHPAASVFHYANEVFEGMKAFRTARNEIYLFRPWLNMERFHEGVHHACLPTFDKSELLKCISKLVDIDRHWVPNEKGCSLYLRPVMLGIEPAVGIRRPKSALFCCFMSPVSGYFSENKPLSLHADPKQTRASVGGWGRYKFGSNYGPTVFAYENAVRQGCDHSLWLYGDDHLITEAGTMNVFIFWKNEQGVNEVVTMGLEDGLVLPGVVRQSVLELLRKWRFNVSERNVGMAEFRIAVKEDRVYEMFGTGTASQVTPINRIKYMGEDLILPVSRHPVSTSLYEELEKIQYGVISHPWQYEVIPQTR